jgi:hypothetical protein
VTDNPRIGEILNVSGVYTDSVDNTWHYAYQIPQFFADTESAKKMNQRIVDEILPEIESEFSVMKHLLPIHRAKYLHQADRVV